MNTQKLSKLVKVLISLAEKLKCPICLEIIQELVELDCGHKYCKQCYSDHKSTQKQLSCALCKKIFKKRSVVYNDNYGSAIGKFVHICCENLKTVYHCEVGQLKKLLDEGVDPFHNKTIILQEDGPRQKMVCANTTLKGFNYESKQLRQSDNERNEKYSIKKTKKEFIREDCESAFDNLVRPQRPITLNKKGTKRVYSNKKIEQKPKLEYNILEFDNLENKTAVLQWLHDTRNKFDRLSQTQTMSSELCKIPSFDMVSVSQIKPVDNNPELISCNTGRKRANSLDIEIKKEIPLQKMKHSWAGSVSLENYIIEDVNTEEEVVKKAEEKVLLDLIENEFIDTLENELEDTQFEIKSKRYIAKKKNKPMSPTSTCGWKRLSKIKKSLNKSDRVPKQLNVTLQSTQERKTNHRPSREISNLESDNVKVYKSDENDDLNRSNTRNEEVNIENKNRSLENKIVENTDEKDDTNKDPKQCYDLNKVEDYISKNYKVMDKDCTLYDATQKSNVLNKSLNTTEAIPSILEAPIKNSAFDHLTDRSVPQADENINAVEDKVQPPKNHSKRGSTHENDDEPNSANENSENEIIVIDDDLSEVVNIQAGIGIETNGNGGKNSFVDEKISKFNMYPSKVYNIVHEPEKNYGSVDEIINLFEESLEKCITILKCVDIDLQDNLQNLKLYLPKLKLLLKNYDHPSKAKIVEMCDAETYTEVNVSNKILQTESINSAKGVQTENLQCTNCNMELNCSSVLNEPLSVSSNAHRGVKSTIDKTKIIKSALNRTVEHNAVQSKSTSQYDNFSCTLDNFNFDTQELIKNQGIPLKTGQEGPGYTTLTCLKEKTSGLENKSKMENCSPDSVLVCSLNSNKTKKISRKLTYPDKRFKRIRQPASDSDSEEESPSKRKCNRFLRDDLTVEFLTNPGITDSTNETKISTMESENSDGINYDEILNQVMKKYEDNNSSVTHTPSFKKTKVSAPKQNVINKCEERINSVSRKKNQTKVVEVSASSSKDSFRTASDSICGNLEECSPADEVFMNEENLMKFEKDIREYEKSTVKGQNSDISDIIGETEEIECPPKKFKKALVHNYEPSQKMIVNKESQDLDSRKQGANLLNIRNSWLADEEILENTTMVPCLNNEKKINILANIKIKSQDKQDTKEDEDLFSDDDIVETTPQKKIDSFAERVAHSQIMSSISFIDNALPLPLNSCTENLDFNITPLPPPPDFQDDVIDIPCTPEGIEEDTNIAEDNVTIIKLNKSSLTPDNLSQYVLSRNTTVQGLPGLSPCILQFTKENKSEEKLSIEKSVSDHSAAAEIPRKQLLYTPNKSIQENTLLTLQDDKFLTPTRQSQVQLNRSHSTPIVEVDLTKESLGFSPITTKKSGKIGMIELAQAVKDTPLNPVTKRTPQKNLLTSMPRQKSMWNFVKPSQYKEEEVSSTIRDIPCIACTRLSQEQVRCIVQLTNKKLVTYSSQFQASVTHMIVATKDKNRVKDYTIKFVSAVASGCWVLRFEWIEECLRKNCIVPEEPFEVLDISGVPGPRIARLTRKKHPLFRGYKFYCAEPFQSASRAEVEYILNMLEGKVLRDMRGLLEKDGKIAFIIGEAYATQDFDQYDRWLDQYKTVTVDIEWLSKCVGQYKILNIRPYVWCSEDNLSDLGYPSTLTEAISYTETM